jgi:predicted phage tail protein
MKTVKLYGHLAKRMGKEFKFDIRTPGEAIMALKANFRHFNEYILENDGPGYALFVDRENKPMDDWYNPCSDREVIQIVPIYAGSGSLKSALTLVVGAALIYFSAGTLAPAIGGVFGVAGGSATIGTISSALIGIGVSLAVSGISGLLFAPPSGINDSEKADNKPNFAFAGAVNTTVQGGPVPVGYGQLIVGSQVISAGLKVEDRGSTETPTLIDILLK